MIQTSNSKPALVVVEQSPMPASVSGLPTDHKSAKRYSRIMTPDKIDSPVFNADASFGPAMRRNDASILAD